jgi:HK97 family phage major capsid protein
LMNPYDWETVELTKDGQNRYYFGGPTALGMKTIWGLPVVESEAVLQGTFYTGDLKQAVLWDRERANIRVGEPNDFFLRNIVAILCELRAAFGVLRPSAIVRGDLQSGPNS